MFTLRHKAKFDVLQLLDWSLLKPTLAPPVEDLCHPLTMNSTCSSYFLQVQETKAQRDTEREVKDKSLLSGITYQSK